MAGSLEPALACDLVLAAEDACIGGQHSNFGLIPGGGATQRRPQRIGMQRAVELLTTGRWLSGAEAAQWGAGLAGTPPRTWKPSCKSCWSRCGARAAPGWSGLSP